MSRTKFRIRGKPKTPKKRGEIQRTIDITYTRTLGGAIEEVWKINPRIDPKDVSLSVENEWDYGDVTSRVELTWREEQSEEEYEEAIIKPYIARLKKYYAWYDENKDQIEEEIALRELEARSEEKTSREKKIKQLEQELAKLEKMRRKEEE